MSPGLHEVKRSTWQHPQPGVKANQDRWYLCRRSASFSVKGTEASHIHIVFKVSQFDFAGDGIRTHTGDKLVVRLMVAMR